MLLTPALLVSVPVSLACAPYEASALCSQLYTSGTRVSNWWCCKVEKAHGKETDNQARTILSKAVKPCKFKKRSQPHSSAGDKSHPHVKPELHANPFAPFPTLSVLRFGHRATKILSLFWSRFLLHCFSWLSLNCPAGSLSSAHLQD